MKQSEAVEIITMIDSMNRGRDSFSPPLIEDGKLKNLGPIWEQELAALEAEFVMEAVIALYTSTSSLERPRPVAPKDLVDMMRKIRQDRRDAIPALPEAHFERKIPTWVRGWMLARAQGDGRAWPEQKRGYDALQHAFPSNRSYVWSEQEIMPEAERDRYIGQALSLTADEFESVYEEVFGSVEGIERKI